ncbi:hypothetical protein CDAR_570471 [Caerostris darwini]|uniref:Uncharacterized protein n=1 Tax=Caerostris darwini TaxID=1538125 RepID=A0AAV4TK94_9ARAC|nr:hypothetical protein CDAR_570471 [Caerostris darwini]
MVIKTFHILKERVLCDKARGSSRIVCNVLSCKCGNVCLRFTKRHVIGHEGAICSFSTGHSNGHHAAAATLSSAGGELDINGSIIRLTSQINDLRNTAMLLFSATEDVLLLALGFDEEETVWRRC